MLQIRTFCRKVFYSFFPSLAIPQFGLLSHISSLRLSSGRSGSALPQRTDDAAGTSLSSPHLLVADASVWATSPWQLWLGTYSVGSFFFFSSQICCPLRFQNSPQTHLYEGFLLFGNFSSSMQRRKWQPSPVFLPGESQGWGSLVGCHLWGRKESDTTKVT